MNFYIMSRGRAKTMTTWKNLPFDVREKTYIVPHYTEVSTYRSVFGDGNVIEPPEWASENYSNKFQWILHDGMKDGKSKCVILDDDLRFATRHGDKHLAIASGKQMIELSDALWSLENHLDSRPLVSFHPRQMAHIQPSPYVENCKVICLQAVNREKVGKVKVNQWPILADVILNAYVLGMGWGNRLLTDVVQDHGSCQAPGGCSDTRTAELQRDAVRSIAAKYSGFITATQKKPKGENWLQDGEGYRWDFRGQWKKLYEQAPWTKEVYDDRFPKVPL